MELSGEDRDAMLLKSRDVFDRTMLWRNRNLLDVLSAKWMIEGKDEEKTEKERERNFWNAL